MKPLPKRTTNLESTIQSAIVKMLTRHGWLALVTHGNEFQQGFPDIFATHERYGHRWIEVKRPDRKSNIFTAAQRKLFPLLCSAGSGVWVLTGATDDEYEKLFKKYNWEYYLYMEMF